MIIRVKTLVFPLILIFGISMLHQIWIKNPKLFRVISVKTFKIEIIFGLQP